MHYKTYIIKYNHNALDTNTKKLTNTKTYNNKFIIYIQSIVAVNRKIKWKRNPVPSTCPQ